MEAIGIADRVAPIARSPLDSARGRRKYRYTYVIHLLPPNADLVVIESPTIQSSFEYPQPV